jgi:hypothetical protein
MNVIVRLGDFAEPKNLNVRAVVRDRLGKE